MFDRIKVPLICGVFTFILAYVCFDCFGQIKGLRQDIIKKEQIIIDIQSTIRQYENEIIHLHERLDIETRNPRNY